MSLTPYMITKLSTRFLSEAEVGASHSKKVRALSGRRIALMPNPTKIVAIALAAIWRNGEREMAMLSESYCSWLVTGRYNERARLRTTPRDLYDCARVVVVLVQRST